MVDMGDDTKISGKRNNVHVGTRAQAAKSVNSAKLLTAQVLSVRRARPARTPPGPSSQNSVAPAAAALRMQSSHKTDETTCWINAVLIATGSLTARPVVFVKTANFGSANGIPPRNAAKAARAGSINRL